MIQPPDTAKICYNIRRFERLRIALHEWGRGFESLTAHHQTANSAAPLRTRFSFTNQSRKMVYYLISKTCSKTTERITRNEIVPVRKHSAQHCPLRAVPYLWWQLPWPARLYRCQRPRRLLGRSHLVGAHGSQFAHLGRGPLALRLSLHTQGPQVRVEVGVQSWSWRIEVFVHGIRPNGSHNSK